MRHFLRRSALAAGVFLIAMIGFLGFLQFSGNFHSVSAGKVYRAAQMDAARLEKWVGKYQIASVLNLRGENIGADWYDAEVETATKLGIQHINFRMSASHELTKDEVQSLLQVMRDAPKPLLIHCQGGADRTGLASALYVAGIDKGDEFAAERQLSLRYGHVGIPGISKAWAMDVTWEEIEPMLGFYDS